MSYGAYLRELLRPLRIYGLEGTANGGELEAQGKALDGVEAAMEEVQREMLICTAEGRATAFYYFLTHNLMSFYLCLLLLSTKINLFFNFTILKTGFYEVKGRFIRH